MPVFGNVVVGCEDEEPEEEGDDHQDAGRREGYQAWDQEPLKQKTTYKLGWKNQIFGRIILFYDR